MKTRLLVVLFLPVYAAAPLSDVSTGDQGDTAIHEHNAHEDGPEVESKERLRLLFKTIDVNRDEIMDAKELIGVCLANNIDIEEAEAERAVTLPDKTVGLTMDMFGELLAHCPSSKTEDILFFLLNGDLQNRRGRFIGIPFGDNFQQWQTIILNRFFRGMDRAIDAVCTEDAVNEDSCFCDNGFEGDVCTAGQGCNSYGCFDVCSVGAVNMDACFCQNGQGGGQDCNAKQGCTSDGACRDVCTADAVNYDACFCKNAQGGGKDCTAGQGCNSAGTCLNVCTEDAVNEDSCFCDNGFRGDVCTAGQECNSYGCFDVCSVGAVNMDACFCQNGQGGGQDCNSKQGCTSDGACLDVCTADAVNYDACFCKNAQGGGKHCTAGQSCNSAGTCLNVCAEDAVNEDFCFCDNGFRGDVCTAGQGCNSYGCLDVCSVGAVNMDDCFCKNGQGVGQACNAKQGCTSDGACLDRCPAEKIITSECMCGSEICVSGDLCLGVYCNPGLFGGGPRTPSSAGYKDCSCNGFVDENMKGECQSDWPFDSNQFWCYVKKGSCGDTEEWEWKNTTYFWSYQACIVIPSFLEAQAMEENLTSSEMMKMMKHSIKTLDSIDKIAPGLPQNPENVKRVEAILRESDFEYLFPRRNALYTYRKLLQAIGKFPAICGTYKERDSDLICKKIMATMFAHITQDTGAHRRYSEVEEWRQGLVWVTEMCSETTPGCEYSATCEPDSWASEAWPCGQNQDRTWKKYFGRGAKQIKYNYNYGPFSDAMFGTVRTLLDKPSDVANTWLNLASATWFFVYPQPPKPSMLFVVDGTWQPNEEDKKNHLEAGFGATIMIIKGGIECGTETSNAINRINYYKKFSEYFKVDIEGEQLSCEHMSPFSSGGSGALPIYWVRNWQQCNLVNYLTAYTALKKGDYVRCLEDKFGVTLV